MEVLKYPLVSKKMCQRWDGSTLEGNFVNGWLEGEGKCTFKDNVVYEGQFRRGDFHGKGKNARGVKI